MYLQLIRASVLVEVHADNQVMEHTSATAIPVDLAPAVKTLQPAMVY